MIAVLSTIGCVSLIGISAAALVWSTSSLWNWIFFGDSAMKLLGFAFEVAGQLIQAIVGSDK